MSGNVELKYKTFDSLLADVMVDFRSYASENLIEPQELLRVTKWVNSDLGLRIYTPKEDILELEKGKVRLPYDFYSFNYGLLCDEGSYTIIPPQGVNIDMIPYPSYKDAPVVDSCSEPCSTEEPSCGNCGNCTSCCPDVIEVPGYNPLKPYGDTCVTPRVFMDCKNNAFELVQILRTETRRWKYMLPLRLVSPNNQISPCCPNLSVRCADIIWINDKFLHSNLDCGKIYINYEGALENENGEILILDHDKVTPYYEYKLKHRILENLFVNGEDVERRLLYIKEQLRLARIEAWAVVKMPNFKEMMDLRTLNHKAYNSRFVDMFNVQKWYGGRY